MRCKTKYTVWAVALTSAFAVAHAAVAQEIKRNRAEEPVKPSVVKPSGAIATETAPHVKRATELIGLGVQNAAGEDLGKIEDLMIDTVAGKVRYAALSFGGFLGFGDKLFAVPMGALKLQRKDKTWFFVLNVERERLKDAPGFAKDKWPDFGTMDWAKEVDAFYDVSPVKAAQQR